MQANRWKVGFVDLGIMGQPMALNVCKAGYQLYVCDRACERTAPLEALGAVRCDLAKAVAQYSDVVIIMGNRRMSNRYSSAKTGRRAAPQKEWLSSI